MLGSKLWGLLLAGVACALLGLLAVTTWWGGQPPPDPVWARVQKAGVLRVGTDPTYPPFEAISNTVYIGYDMDLARALATGLGVRAEFVNLPLDGQYDALFQDKVDVLISALPFIWERQKEVRYSSPYYNAAPLLIVRSAGEAGIGGPGDLAGRRVAVELGSEGDMVARRLLRAGTPLLLDTGYTSPDAALAALAAGGADAAIADPLALAAYQQATPTAGVAPLHAVAPLADQPYVVAMRLQARRLGPAINSLLAALQADGRLAHMMGEP